MSLFGTLGREIKGTAGGLSWGQIDQLWGGLFGGVQSRSGPAVNWLTSLRVTAMLACTRRIAEGVSTVPMKVYRRTPGTNRRVEATDHPLYELLNSGPNEWQDTLQFREQLTIHAALASNAYTFINRVNGRIAELIPLQPGHVETLPQPDRSVLYRVTAPDGTSNTLDSEFIWHIRGLSWDGYRGIDTVRLAREAIGLALASEQTHAMVHANGARPSGIVSVAKNLDKPGLIQLAAWVRRHYGGLDNTSRVMVLDNDAKFTPFDMKGVDAQHVQLRQHEVEEICRAMGVMPMVIGHPADMAARAAVEQILMIHLVHTIRPWHRRFEKSADRQLLLRKERGDGIYTKFADGEFLRAAAKDRAEYMKIALGGGGNPGWLTPNDARGFEDLDTIEGGDNLYAPVTVAPIGADGTLRRPTPAAGTEQQPPGQPQAGN